MNKQSQTGGDNSQQVQVGSISNLTIVNGITEQRAREIYQEMNQQAISNYTRDAYSEALRRIGNLEKRFMKRVEEVDGVLDAFGDPAFQVLLREVQKRAAATEREADYQLLSELLVCHVQKGECRTNRAGINRAVEIVGDVDTNALCALTVAHAVESFIPTTGNISEGLQVLNELLSKLMYEDLPSGNSWLDHLDLLGAVRLAAFGEMKKLCEYYSDQLSGYVCTGIERSSDVYLQAMDILTKAHINPNILVDNECLDGYVRLSIPSKNAIRMLSFPSRNGRIPLAENQIEALEQVWNLYIKDSTLIQQSKNKFSELLSGFDSIKKCQQWWDGIPGCFDITQVGKVLAHTNAKRCDPRVPDMV